ncbi:MAG: ferredoxin:glutaredoxin reductase [Proteobacteria bacterium]|nr:ferredoxin:glutaredoxin reductase [Pseudomonadota bacterium]
MIHENEIDPKDVDTLYEKLSKDAGSSGYYLNPDIEFTKALISGLITNQKRYGYSSCPCRLAAGNKADDLDIICPCDYRDQDLNEYGACYCALYVSKAVVGGERKVSPIPERRPPIEERKKGKANNPKGVNPSLSYPVWRCKVCGYLCARENPPEVCPICKAKQERFERFI